jgi:hypothetical protein
MLMAADRLRLEGEAKGEAKGKREILLLLLRRRFGRLPAATVARIREANAAQLDRWILRVLPAKTLNDVLPARARRKA